MRALIPVLIASCLGSLAAQERRPGASASRSAPDFTETVIPITSFQLAIRPKMSCQPTNLLSYIDLEGRGEFGTGFCVDPACRFVATNYHVAATAQPRKIRGEKIVRRYLATGPDDEGASMNGGPSLAPMKYNVTRDLAIFELRRPLRHHHGAGYNLAQLSDGQEVEIYAYPKERNPIRQLLRFQGRYKGETQRGLLAFDYTKSGDKTIRGGASGGIVVETKTQQIVGILNGVAENAETVAFAVPVQSLVEFLSKAQPYLTDTIFPHRTDTIAPVSADLYPKFLPAPSDGLQRRPEESSEVKLLRSKAQFLADSLHNFIAVQTFAWGSGNKEPAAEAEYEVQVIDGYQRFREYPDGKKRLEEVPLPARLNVAFTTGGQWSELPAMVGTKLDLKIHEAQDAEVNNRRMKIFQYQASVEDRLCTWDTQVDYGLVTTHKIASAPVYGEVWTDEDMDILRISEHCELPENLKWKDFWAVVTYGWLGQTNHPQLIPLTIYSQAEFRKRTYWCRGAFIDYKEFSSRIKILSGAGETR